jgi:hypothetical protein
VIRVSSTKKTILLRAVRSLAAVVLGFVAAWVVGPDALSLVPDAYDPLVVAAVAPALLALEKFVRDGGDAQA